MSKKRFFWGLMSRWGSKVPNSLVKTTIQSFLLQTSRNVPKHAMRGWVVVQSPKQIHGILSKNFLMFSKKQNAPNRPKSKINPTFIFHLVESQTCAAVGGVRCLGQSPKKNVFFYTFPYDGLLSMTMTKTKTMTISMMCYP